MSIARLSREIQGELLQPGSSGFDESRILWNGRADRQPAMIARCRSASDIKACVDVSREEGLGLSIKGGGHSYATDTVSPGGLLIDLSLMKGVQVDPLSATALVEPGVTCGELDQATQEHGLATPSPTVSSVGVAGAVLGGGSGYLSRKYGLMLDNLIGVDVVTADGRQIRASQEQHPDLFWALRGAGANFGVATSFEFQLHSVGTQVLAGQIIYPFERAVDLLRFFRSFMGSAPDELQCYPFIFRVPPIDPFPPRFHNQLALDFVVFHLDPNASTLVEPLRGLGEPILDVVGPLPYTAAQQSFDTGLPKGQRYYSKAHYLNNLSDAAIETIVDHAAGLQGPFTVAYLEPLGGAVGRVSPSAAAFQGRQASYSFHIQAGWADASQDEGAIAWARTFHQALAPYASGGVYVNLLAEDEGDRVPAAYGENYERLRQLKRVWDPQNLFRMNRNIKGA